MNQRTGRRWGSLVGRVGLLVALLGGVLLLIAAFGYRTGAVGLGTSFSLLRWGAYVGGGGVLVSVVAVALAVSTRTGGLALGALGALIGVVCYALPAQQQSRAQSLPPIHDITTDVDDPPVFVDVLPLREGAPNSAEYDPGVAERQQAAYPDLGPIHLDMSPAEAETTVERVAKELGWDVVSGDVGDGRVEAVATTFWFGFKDDVVVRVRPDEGGSRVDVRSVSRVGLGDVGANARRIRTFRDALTGG